MGFHYQKSILIAKQYPDVPYFQISGVWYKYKGVKNPHVLYVFTAWVEEDTEVS